MIFFSKFNKNFIFFRFASILPLTGQKTIGHNMLGIKILILAYYDLGGVLKIFWPSPFPFPPFLEYFRDSTGTEKQKYEFSMILKKIYNQFKVKTGFGKVYRSENLKWKFLIGPPLKQDIVDSSRYVMNKPMSIITFPKHLTMLIGLFCFRRYSAWWQIVNYWARYGHI